MRIASRDLGIFFDSELTAQGTEEYPRDEDHLALCPLNYAEHIFVLLCMSNSASIFLSRPSKMPRLKKAFLSFIPPCLVESLPALFSSLDLHDHGSPRYRTSRPRPAARPGEGKTSSNVPSAAIL